MAAAYTYDKLNQMTKETRYTYSGSSTTAASTTVVSYDLDMAGNLYAVTENGSVKLAYTYGDPTWADKLTAVTVNGTTKTIQYADALNPANWYNGTDYTNLTWTQGRRLSSITKGSQTYSYEYDMSGVRSVKIAEGLKHEYVTQNGHVVRDTVTNASTGAFQYMLDFTYDESGHPLTMRRYKNEAQTSYNTYHYVVNGQGDVVKQLHGTNTTVAEYTYDAYGNVLTKSGSLADLNPLRYRGYYCDTETGFYYLQSRYYDPTLGRFINADSYASTGQGFLGYNMFAYCGNNPIFRSDPSGHIWILDLIIDRIRNQVTEAVTGNYNRNDAVDYALEYAEEKNPDYPYFSGGDCTNFVSQCLSQGGMKQTELWCCEKSGNLFRLIGSLIKKYYAWEWKESWSVASSNFNYLTNVLTLKSVKASNPEELANVVQENNVQIGDVMYFENGSGIHHAAIITKIENGKVYISQHSSAVCKDREIDDTIPDSCYYIVLMP